MRALSSSLAAVFALSITTILTVQAQELSKELVDMGVAFQGDSKNYVRVSRYENFNLQAAVPHLARIPGLKILQIDNCSGVKDLNGIRDLPIEVLNLSDCEELQSLAGLKGHPTLTSLDLSDCPKVTDTTGIANLRNLKHIEFARLRNVTNIDGLRNLPALEELIIYNATGIQRMQDLRAVAGLRSLKHLGLSDTGITDLVGLGRLPALEKLHVGGCKNLTSLNGLQTVPSLKHLDIQGCPVSKLDQIGRLKKLEILSLGRTDLLSLSGVQALTNLRGVMLSNNEKLLNISALVTAKGLEQFECGLHTKLKNIDVLQRSKSLRWLKIPEKYATATLILRSPSLEIVMGVPQGSSIIRKASKVKFLHGREALVFYHKHWNSGLPAS